MCWGAALNVLIHCSAVFPPPVWMRINSHMQEISTDFELIFGGASGFNKHAGPFYMSVKNELGIVAFKVEEKHLNPAGGCHGAVLATLADQVGAPIKRLLGLEENITPTINLSIDYIAPAMLGDWVELHTSLLRQTRTLLFCQGLICVNDTVIARVNATYMISSRKIEMD